MEEKRIACVAAYPVLYDTSLYLYKYIKNKYEAWGRVAYVVSAPGNYNGNFRELQFYINLFDTPPSLVQCGKAASLVRSLQRSGRRGASASNSFSIKPGVDARVGHCGKASGALKVGFSQLYVNEERENSVGVGQSDWCLVYCNVATVGHGKHF